jgi:biopolymer transport protein ExbD
VRIDADRNVRFEEVVRIVDLCTFEGLRNVGLHTRGERAR